MKAHVALVAATLLFVFARPATADEITLELVPPVVIKTVPEAGAKDVDPQLTEIQATFSKEMSDRSWSSTPVSKDTFPQVTALPKFLPDKRTFVLSVRLEPGRTYAVLLNSDKFKNFRDADGHPALPYLLTFRTRGGAGGAANDAVSATINTPAAADGWSENVYGKAFDGLWEDMDARYSYFFLKKDVDWLAQKQRYRLAAIQSRNTDELARVLQEMLGPLRDLHVTIDTPGGVLPTAVSGYVFNGNHRVTYNSLTNATSCGTFAVVAQTKRDGFGYFLMVRQNEANEESVRQAVEAMEKLQNAPGFIVDLRQANGGSEVLAQQLARVFCAQDVTYAKSKYRNGPGHDDFTEAYPRLLKASDHPYTRPVVCLIGPGAVSSGEGMVKMMQSLPNVTTVGLPTRGASGKPLPHELPGTGLTVNFSTWVDLVPDGTTFEGIGLPPDVRVEEPAQSYENRDPTLEKGIEILREKVFAEKAPR